MNKLKLGELEILVTEGNPTTIRWIGISQSQNPQDRIGPFFEELAQHLRGEEVVIDFTKLDFMNSSTVPPIIDFCRIFDQLAISTTIQFDGTSEWQLKTFKGLDTLARVLENIEVEPVMPET